MFNLPTIPIARTVLASASNSIDLEYFAPDVAWTPRHLIIRAFFKAASGQPTISVRINGDSGNNYNTQRLKGNGTTESAGIQDAATSWSVAQGEAGDWGMFEMVILDAFSQRSFKSFTASGHSGGVVHHMFAGCWTNTDIIESVTVHTSGTNLITGSVFELSVVDESFLEAEDILSSPGEFNFPSLGTGNGDLCFLMNVRTTRASTVDTVSLRFNGDTTGGNYDYQKLSGSNTGFSAAAVTNASRIAAISAANCVANTFSAVVGHIPNNADTTSSDRGAHTQGGYSDTATSGRVERFTQKWDNTAAVNRLSFEADNGDFVANSMVSVYRVATGEEIARIEVTSGTLARFTFSSIPSTYEHLEVSYVARSDRSGSVNDVVEMFLNNDTTYANYDHQLITAVGTLVQASSGLGNPRIGLVTGNSATANDFGYYSISLPNYTKAYPKAYQSHGGTDINIRYYFGVWDSTATINRIDIEPLNNDEWMVGSIAILTGHRTALADPLPLFIPSVILV